MSCKFCEHREHGEDRCGVLITMSMFGPHSYCECDGKEGWRERILGVRAERTYEEWEKFYGKEVADRMTGRTK